MIRRPPGCGSTIARTNSALPSLATAMLQALFLPILWQGLGIAFIGFGMTVAGYYVEEKLVA